MVLETIINALGIPRSAWKLGWFVERYAEVSPYWLTANILLIGLIFLPAIRNRVGGLLGYNYKSSGIFLWDITKHQVLTVICLAVLCGIQLWYVSSRFDPYSKIESDKTLVLILPIFGLDDTGGFKVSEDSEYIQAQIRDTLTPDNKDVEIVALGRDEYPFRAYTPTTFSPLLDSISKHTSNNFFYLYAIKHGEKYELFGFRISPGGEAEPGQAKDRQYYERYSNVFSQLLNSSDKIPQTLAVQFSTKIFSALVAQAHTHEYLDKGMFQAAEDGTFRAYNLAVNTCGNMRNTPSIRKVEAAMNFCKDFIGQLARYKKMAYENNLERKAASIFSLIERNPFLPFNTEQQYIKWLTSQEAFGYMSRYILNPLGGWPRLNTKLDEYVGNLVFTNPIEVPTEKIIADLDKIIKGQSWVKSYYLFLICSVRHDIPRMKKYKEELAQFNQQPDETEKAEMLIEAMEEIDKTGTNTQGQATDSGAVEQGGQRL